MSTVLRTPAQAPAFSANSRNTSRSNPEQLRSLRHADTPERWASALKRAQDAGIQAYRITKDGVFAVTSATDPTIAYIVNAELGRCTCPAGQANDPVCIHRALVRSIVNPQPEPPAHQTYNATAEQLQWAHNDRERAYRDLERYSTRIEAGDVLSDREWFAFEYAQQREQDASARIAELSVKVQVAA